jgi:hypothetical protein
MISEEIKQKVTKLQLFNILIFNTLRHNLSVTNFKKVAKVTKVTERLHAKNPLFIRV